MPLRRADDALYTLAENASSTGAAVAIKGGEYIFQASGTPGGTTTSLQIQTPNGTWSDIAVYSGSFVRSTNLPYSQTGIDLPPGNVRVAMTGGTPSAIYAYLVGMG